MDRDLVGGCVTEAIFEDEVGELRFVMCLLRFADGFDEGPVEVRKCGGKERDIDQSANGHRYPPAADEVVPNILLSSDVVTDIFVRGEAYGPM